MQQMFGCPRCGWQNMIGQRFCGSCGETFQYNCPYCNAFVDPAYTTCPTCGASLTWGFQQQAEAQPVGQEPAYQQQQPYQQQQAYPPQQSFQQQPYEQQQPPPHQQQQAYPPQTQEAPAQPPKGDALTREALKKKRKMNQLIVLAAATGLLICIGVAIYLTVTTFSQETTPSAPVAPPASSGNQTSQKPFDNDIYIAFA